MIISDYLNYLDLLIMGFFILTFLLVPKFFKNKVTHSSYDQDYLLMSRGLSLPLFVATLTSTWYGGILGVTQIAYENGIYSFFTQGLFWYAAYFIFAVFLAKKVREKKVMSLPELVGQKFGEKSRKLSAIILFFHALPVTYAISVGILLQLCLGIDFLWAQILGVSIVAIYTSIGGFRGVVITDCLQFILMFIAVLMVTFACLYRFGGISFLTTALPSHYFTWHGDHHFSSALIWLFIACTSTFIHPVFYQRCLAAKSDTTAVLGIFLAMVFWLIFDLCTMLGGMYAKALLPNTNSATAFLELGCQLFPHGFLGLFLSGVLATILSTLDSFMFVSGTSISYDLIGKHSYLGKYAHQISILFSGGLVIVLGLMFKSNFEATWLFMEGAFSTSMMVPVLASVWLNKRFSDGNFLIPALGTLLAFVTATLFYHIGWLSIEPFYVAHCVALLLFLIVSYVQAKGGTKMANAAHA